ncbi:MAG: glycosyltransferase, partial [Bacteroidetes bacterium]|nr:glycosyltransferase [Bacteroidota bacterium]
MITGKNSEHKISVVFIIGHLSHGGAEKQLFILTKGIDKNKFNPVVLCLSKESHPWGDRIIESGVKIVYIPRLSRFDVTRILRLAWFFYKYNADIIISSLHIGNVYSWLAGLLYFSKSRYIAQVRSKENQMSGMVRWLNVRAFNSADVIITNSKLLNSFVEKFFKQNSSKIVTINNGIKIQKSKKLKNDIGVIHIGTIGKDTQAKNIDLFIDFALKLLTNQENICFHLCGRGLENSSRLFKRIPGKSRTLFNFHGEVNNPNSIYQMLDIYVSTSFSEGSPHTILEAMS